ncbi:MAG: FCD domain-containing protein [Acidobacteria bacterium]|nr:FCD domain-containing protein [Acidobacteriota bacterium]
MAVAGNGSEDPISIVEAVLGFHWLVALQSEHDLLLSHLKNLKPQLRRLIFYTNLYESDEVFDVDSHSEVLEALRTGDAEHAERTVFEHHSRSG